MANFNMRGNQICEGSGSKTILNIRSNQICEGSGSKTILNIRSNEICEGSGSKTIAHVADARKAIDGAGAMDDVTAVALWWAATHKR